MDVTVQTLPPIPLPLPVLSTVGYVRPPSSNHDGHTDIEHLDCLAERR